MTEIFNLRALSLDESPFARDGHRFHQLALGQSVGAKLTGASLYELPPGEGAWPYHYELNREEWLLVVAGEVTLRTRDGERVLRAGDIVCFPVGERGLHAMRNDTAEPARYLMPSTDPPHISAAIRPDGGTAFIVGPDFSATLSLADQREFWDGEP